MRGGRKLLVISSPDAQSSPYVNRQVHRFVAPGRGNVIPITIPGLPNSDIKRDDEAKLALPDELCSAVKMLWAIDYCRFDIKKKCEHGPASF